MNKNRWKITFWSSLAVLLCSIAGFVAAPAATAATTPTVSKSSYVGIPLNFTRAAPTMKSATGCNRVVIPAACQEWTGGIGIYNYVSGTHSTEYNNIGYNGQTAVHVQDATLNTTFDTFNFDVISNQLRVYGLTIGHDYSFTFDYSDASSADIVALLNLVPNYCLSPLGGTQQVPQNEKNADRIANDLLNGCQVYSTAAFTPAKKTVTVPSASGTTIKYAKPVMVVTPISIQAPAPATTAQPASGDLGTDPCGGINPVEVRWFACPLTEGLVDASAKADEVLGSFLFVPIDQIFTTQLHTAWMVFRNLGVALILIVGLVMVASQAAGMELFDAYTVRKVLPRLMIAAIGIALSWPLLKYTVTFFNDLGVWANNLIITPFANVGPPVDSAAVMFESFGLSIGAVSYLGGLGIFGIISLIGTILIALLIGLVVLTIRQLVILIAILMAPLAIAAYILPGTQKLWKFWKDTLLTALIMYPMIMAFIAAGKALSKVAASANGVKTLQLISLIAYFAPYFLLPFAFKLAGGLMSTVFSIANDRSRGFFDKGRKKRQEIRDDRRTRGANSGIWDEKQGGKLGAMAKIGNRAANWRYAPAGTYSLTKLGQRTPGFKKEGAKVASSIDHQRYEQTRKLLEEIYGDFNDKGFRGLNGGLHEELSGQTKDRLKAAKVFGKNPQSLGELRKVAEILQQSDDMTERLGGQAIKNHDGRFATLYQDNDMAKASIAAAGAMGLAGHGFFNRNDTSRAMEAVKEQSGGSGGFMTAVAQQTALLASKSRPDLKNGYGMQVVYDDAGAHIVDGLGDVTELGGGARGLQMVTTLGAGDIGSVKAGFFKKQENGGSREIIDYVLKNGQSNEGMAGEVRQRLSALSSEDREAQVKAWDKSDKAEEREKGKIAMAQRQFETVVAGLQQNAGSYSHGNMEASTAAAEVLQTHNIEVPGRRRGTGATEDIPEAVKAEAAAADAAASAGGPPAGGPPAGGPPGSKGPFGG